MQFETVTSLRPRRRDAALRSPDVSDDLDWIALTRRNARSVQTLIGWIFWDPGAVSRYEELGLNGPWGYVAARAAPFAGAGAQSTTAAWGSISSAVIATVFVRLATPRAFVPFWEARNAAVLDGLTQFAPEARDALVELGPALWSVAEQLPTVARPFFASHLELARPEHPVLVGWHAVNRLHEWRGDTHWAIVTSVGLNGAEASILHNEWLGYDDNWLSRSRGQSPDLVNAAWMSLEAKGFAAKRQILDAGLQLRQWIEDETDRRTTTPWELAGRDLTDLFHRRFVAPCELLLTRVDLTAGPNYQPASRNRPPFEVPVVG